MCIIIRLQVGGDLEKFVYSMSYSLLRPLGIYVSKVLIQQLSLSYLERSSSSCAIDSIILFVKPC